MKNVFHFTEEEKKQIQAAVEDLEKVSSGEIVPYFVHSSDNYMDSCWKSSAMFGVISVVLIGIMSFLWLLPDWVTPIEICLFIMGWMILGFIIPFLSIPIRAIISDDNIVNTRVSQKAETAFLEEGVYKTIDRTGILIFISYVEHKVIVMGDEGINAKVSANDWDEVVNIIVSGIKSKKVSDGIVQAIHKCKELLLANGFTVRHDDTNELSDHLRI